MDELDTQSIFAFMDGIHPLLSRLTKEIESGLWDDPKSILMKSRLLGEELVKAVFEKEGLDVTVFPSNYERISYLSREGYLIQEIQKRLDSVRVLGNKAVHQLEFGDLSDSLRAFKLVYELCRWFAETYGPPELEIPSLRYPDRKTESNIDSDVITNLIQKILKDQLAGLRGPEKEDKPEDSSSSGTVSNLEQKEIEEEKPVSNYTSQLYYQLTKLRESSQEAVESAGSFSAFKRYLHVEREIQRRFEMALEEAGEASHSKLILLCGSVGDGKSHLLAYINKNKNDLVKPFRIHNDATESSHPHKNAIETLEEWLQNFSDQELDQSGDKLILAINLGVLNNFLESHRESGKFGALERFVHQSGVFDQNKVSGSCLSKHFHLISFTDYHPYELTKEGPRSPFIEGILKKITEPSDHNPFHKAYQIDLQKGHRTIVHQNYELLKREEVQTRIVQLLIETIIKEKLAISARSLFNFIAELLIPDGYTEEGQLQWSPVEQVENLLPNLLFNRKERSPMLAALYHQDPVHRRVRAIDDLLVQFHTAVDPEKVFREYMDQDLYRWLGSFDSNMDEMTDTSKRLLSQTLIRLAFLTSDEFEKQVRDPVYEEYIKDLYAFNTKDTNGIRKLYQQLPEAVFRWNGSPKKNYIFFGSMDEKYKVAQYLELKPDINHLHERSDSILVNFKQTISLAFHDGNKENIVFLELDFPLYKLVKNVLNGYCPNKKDRENGIRLVEFIDKILRFGKQKEELLLCVPEERKMFRLTQNFGQFSLERETT